MTDHEIVTAMLKFGGSFVQSLARCWQAADAINKARLKDAFSDVWLRYEDFVRRGANVG